MKTAIYICMGIGGAIGAYAPVLLWGAGVLDISSLLGSFVGSLLGIWAGYIIAKRIGLE